MTPQRTIAHYRITAKLGEGGMGELARPIQNWLEMTIKVISRLLRARVDGMALRNAKGDGLTSAKEIQGYRRHSA